MRLYFIGQKGIPSKSGGVEKHVEELSVKLARAGHEVFVYTRPNYTEASLKKYKGVNLISIPSIGTKRLDAISHTFRVCFDVAKREADLVHFHSIGPSSLIWLIKLLRPNLPIVATFHTRCYQHKKWGVFAKAYLKFGEFMICILPDVTVAVSNSLADYVKKEYGTKAAYIPNGVSIPENEPVSAIKQWGLTKNNYILTVSRLVRHKGVHYLIDAYKQLGTNKKLVIVGDSSFTDDYVQELKKLAGGNKNIIFTGGQSGKVLNELFSNAYLFVQPSESEGLSIALLEAMAYEKAVLVSDIPENLEAVGEIGFSFKNKSVQHLKNKLDYLLTQPSLVDLHGRLGKERVKKYYSWRNISGDILTIYSQEILKRQEKLAGKHKLVKKFIHYIF